MIKTRKLPPAPNSSCSTEKVHLWTCQMEILIWATLLKFLSPLNIHCFPVLYNNKILLIRKFTMERARRGASLGGFCFPVSPLAQKVAHHWWDIRLWVLEGPSLSLWGLRCVPLNQSPGLDRIHWSLSGGGEAVNSWRQRCQDLLQDEPVELVYRLAIKLEGHSAGDVTNSCICTVLYIRRKWSLLNSLKNVEEGCWWQQWDVEGEGRPFLSGPSWNPCWWGASWDKLWPCLKMGMLANWRWEKLGQVHLPEPAEGAGKPRHFFHHGKGEAFPGFIMRPVTCLLGSVSGSQKLLY